VSRELKLGSRLLLGGIAGFVGTMAMTAAMRRLHERLPERERYPLTPREIIDSAAEQADVPLTSEAAKDMTTAAHFAYGAACGSILGAVAPRIGPAGGAAAGLGVWFGSYLGWIPAAGILKSATDHPPRRNALMISVHLVWGAATALAMRELVAIRETMIEDGPDGDAPPDR
jgi:uncharacterized membrane protein YagU involved in acid resistance